VKVARVVGNVVASAHHPAYDARTILLVRPEAPDGAAAGKAYVAIDTVQAGIGDRVLVLTEGGGVRQILGKSAGPIRSVIVGIVDDVHAPA
jgi:ethanolamine utilization protein EutN